MRTDWEYFSILENGLTFSLYNFITIGIATGVCASVTLLYYHFCYDSFKKLLHRQRLAKMLLENKWYDMKPILYNPVPNWPPEADSHHGIGARRKSAPFEGTAANASAVRCSGK